MDGDLAPLSDLAFLAERYDATLYVDDAHGTGIMGPTGRGTIEQFGLEQRIPFHMGTLSKALGSHGAYIVGSDDVIQYLINVARPFMFATALPPAIAAAAAAALAVIQREPERRTRLWSNRQRLFKGMKQLGCRMTPTVSPILPILVGEAACRIGARRTAARSRGLRDRHSTADRSERNQPHALHGDVGTHGRADRRSASCTQARRP